MKRWISLLLVLCLCAGLLPAAASAEELTHSDKMQIYLPDYPVGTPEMAGVQYSALGAWLIAYARNPSLLEHVTLLLSKTAGGQLVPDPDQVRPEGPEDPNRPFQVRYLLQPQNVPDFDAASTEVQAEIGSVVGDLLIAYARNPSLTVTFMRQMSYFGLAREIPEAEWPEDLKEGEKPGIQGFELLPMDTTQEGFQIAKAESMAGLLIGYARNPDLVGTMTAIYEQAFGTENPKPEDLTPAVQAAWVRTAGAMLIAYARNPSLLGNLGIFEDEENTATTNSTQEPAAQNLANLFNTYSPIPFSELSEVNAEAPVVQAAQLSTLGPLLISYARNPSLKERLDQIYDHLHPVKDTTPLAQRGPLVQAAAVEVFGLLNIAYARNPSLYENLIAYLEADGLAKLLSTDPQAPVETRWQYVQPDRSLEEVQLARIDAVADTLIGCARNPSLRQNLMSILARTTGFYSALPVPYTPAHQAAQARILNGLMIADVRNPSLLENMLGLIWKATISPLPMGEGYVLNLVEETMTVQDGYRVVDDQGKDLGRTVDLKELRNQNKLDLWILGPLHAAGFLDQAQTQPCGRERLGQLHIPADGRWTPAPTRLPEIQSRYDTAVVLEPMEPYVTEELGTNPVQYSCDGGLTWQDSNIFNGLEPEGDYTFAVRYAGRMAFDTISGGAPLAAFAEPLPPSPEYPALWKAPSPQADPAPAPQRTEHADGSVTTTQTHADGSQTAVTTTPDGGKTTVETDTQGRTTVTASPSEPGRSTVVLVPVEYGKPGLAAVIIHADGTEEVVRQSVNGADGVYLTVDETVELKIVDLGRSFSDTEGHWASDAVAYVTSRQLFNGVSQTAFAPDQPMSRAMLAKVLHNLESNPAAGSSVFTDVPAGQWYAEAVAWAAERGIVTGVSDTEFAPDGLLTREQLAVMLWRYVGSPAPVLTELDFADGAQAGDYAREALLWAVETGILTGIGANRLEPQGQATRAQVATMLQRYQLARYLG